VDSASAALRSEGQVQAWSRVVATVEGAGLVCSGCQQACAVDALKACGACKLARYCSKACQLTDWKRRHKVVCASLRVEAVGDADSCGLCV
jgi:hypothetical protein